MRAAIVVLVVVVAGVPASAAPRKILVLPLGGNVDRATRTKWTAEVARLAHKLDGKVAVGDTTFAETAVAVGCDPHVPACVDDVIASLAVDELVYGSATVTDGETKLILRRSIRATPPREVAVIVPPNQRPDQLEHQLAPLFDASDAPVAPVPVKLAPATVPAGQPADPLHPASAPDASDRSLGIASAVGGGVALVIGLALWVNESSLQGDIDHHKTMTLADLQDLHSLEDKASTYAVTGDLMVLLGLGLGALGGYLLYRDHQAHRVIVTPMPLDHGAGVGLVLVGGLR